MRSRASSFTARTARNRFAFFLPAIFDYTLTLMLP
jgi:hypothetical protein